jgi:hypothetical protein
MMNSVPDEFKARIQRLASAFPYPATPDLTTRTSLDRNAHRSAPGVSWQKLARYALAILILVAAASLLVPGVRAAVLEFLQIGGLRIYLETPTPGAGSQALPAEASPPASQTALPSLFSNIDLAGETSLEQVLENWQAPILLPGESSTLGLPDRVFLQRRNASIAILLWTDPADDERLHASLIVMKPGALLSKDPPDSFDNVQVRGRGGLWLQGIHNLFFENAGSGADEILSVVGNVLIWEEDGFTYRLESFFDLEQSQATAESLRPYP